MYNIKIIANITKMKIFLNLIIIKYLLLILTCIKLTSAVTMEQFEQSLEMMRNGCAPKFKLSTEQLDELRNGIFVDNNPDIRCYARCIAQLAGTVTKKGDLSVSKAIAQIPIILPAELQDSAKAALNACKDVQKDYKESCDRIYYTTKCVRNFEPESFKFP